MNLDDAIARAKDVGLDLIEVSPNAKPPVAKILNYGKLKYEGEFLNDKQEGLWKLYYENGDIHRENIFKNHIKISEKEFYEGKKIKHEGKYDEINQDKIGKWCFYFGRKFKNIF